jgi:site-specific DNA-adenine methylase
VFSNPSPLTPVVPPPQFQPDKTKSVVGFTYPGGKKTLAHHLIKLLPTDGNTFAEIFAGRGNLFFRVQAALNYDSFLINDIRTAPFFNALRDFAHTIRVPYRTAEVYGLSYKSEFQRLKDLPQDDPEKIILEPFLSFSGAGYRAGIKTGRGCGSSAGYKKTLLAAQEILRRTNPTVTSLQWHDAISMLGTDDVAYVDPPYRDCRVYGYSDSDLDHDQLIRVLKTARFRWMLSEYRHPSYFQAFGEPLWSKQINGTQYGPGKIQRTECGWRNY